MQLVVARMWSDITAVGRKGHEAIAELLLGKGINVDANYRYSWTPVLCPPMSGHEAETLLSPDQLNLKKASIFPSDRPGSLLTEKLP
jgi:hypothetical protein